MVRFSTAWALAALLSEGKGLEESPHAYGMDLVVWWVRRWSLDSIEAFILRHSWILLVTSPRKVVCADSALSIFLVFQHLVQPTMNNSPYIALVRKQTANHNFLIAQIL